MRRREIDAFARKPERGFHEPSPRQLSMFARKRLEAGGQSGHAARSRTDGVMNELRAEGDIEVEQLGLPWLDSQPGHGDEAVQVADAPTRGLEVHGMASAE